MLSGITAAGGGSPRPVSAETLNSVKTAHSTKVAEDIEWAKAKREANAEEQAAKRRNEEQEAEQRI